MKILLLFIPLCLFAQNPNTAIYPGAVATDAQLTVACRVDTTITGDMTGISTSVTVASTTGMLNGCTITVGSEHMLICGISGSTVSFGYSSCPNVDGRGFSQTIATTHAASSRALGNITPWSHNQMAAEIKAIETGGAMVYPVPGVANSTGSAWGTSYSVVTTLGTPGANTNLPTEAAVRAAISSAGGGDASTNTSTSVDSEIALFSGTAGKTIKRATGTGIAKVTSGVLGTAVAGDFPTLNQNTTGTASAAPVFAGSGGVTVSSSATPAFSFAASSSKSPTVIKFTPVVNVTGPTFSNLSAGARSLLFITTDGTHTWSWNSTVADNVCNVWTQTAGTTIAEVFVDPDGTTVHGGSCIGGPTGLLSLVTTGTVCASNPASGSLCVWADLTDNTVKAKDASGNITVLPRSAASRTANQFVTHIPGTGIAATAAIAQADLPVMTGDSGSGGAKGAVPAPATGDAAAGKFLKADGTWVAPSGSGAASDAHYVTTQAESGLSAESNLGALSTGWVKIAVSAGVATPSTVSVTLPYGCAVGDPAGSALSTGVLCYVVVPMAGTITGWDIVVDAGTATVDAWKIAAGTAKPTVTNTITASAKPAISTGTVIHSTTLTSWTTSVAANDIIGFNLDTVATAKYITVNLQIAH